MMIRFDFKRLFIAVLLIFVVQTVAYYILSFLNIGGIIASAIVDFVLAFALVLFYTPKSFRKYALKTPTFHYNVLIYFAILFVLTLLQYL